MRYSLRESFAGSPNNKTSAATHSTKAGEIGDWSFFDDLALKLPAGWRVLSQSKQPGLGSEVVIGKADDYYARLFVSGDKMSDAEFVTRMKAVIEEKKKDSSITLMADAKIVDISTQYLPHGHRLDLRFETRLKGKAYYEIHAPLVVGGQGLDVHFVAPRASYATSSSELEALLNHLAPYWIAGHPQQHHDKNP